MKKNRKFRHELKYLINEMERDSIMLHIGDVLHLDPHAKNGQYMIRSLYFDDMWDSAYEDKLVGVVTRKKYRIRVYDYQDTIIKLECKNKEDQYINKVAANLTRNEVDQILSGKFDFLKKREEEVCKNFYIECVSNHMVPKVIVDYDRIPYIYEPGDVRITFDMHVRAGMLSFDIFDNQLPTIETLEAGTLVMEVKYTEFLPEIIRNILPPASSELMAISKYVICREKRNELIGM